MFMITFFTTLPLLAAGAITSKAATSMIDDAIWDAAVEGVLALLVFGLASAMMSSYRKRNSKTLRQQQKAKAMPAQSDRHNTKKFDNEYNETKSSSATARSRPGSGARTVHEQAADALASHVKAGKAANLPKLLDAALARSLDAKMQDDAISDEEVATSLLHSALRACAAAHCFKEAIAAYDHMADRIGGGSSGLWSVLLYIIVEVRAFQRCKLVFANLCKQGQPSGHDFVNMVRCYAGKEDSQGLREMITHQQSSAESLDTYTLNRALAACGGSACALDLAEELCSASICKEGLDNVSYNTLMKYSARAGKFARCFELHAEMLENGLEASEVTYGVLLDACVSGRKFDQARKVFDDLCASGLRLNVVHCTTYIKGLVSAQRLDEAAKVVREMTNSIGVKPDVVTYSTIVGGYSGIGDVTSALKMVEQMIEEGVRPDEMIYNSVLSACSVFPLTSAAVVNTFETLVKHGLKPTTTTLSILLKGMAHSEAYTASLKLLNEAPQTFHLQPELRLYSQLAQACAKTRAFGMVVDVFNAMLETAKRRKETVDPAIAGRFLRSCLLGGSVETAEHLHNIAHRSRVSIDPQVEKMLKTATSKRQHSCGILNVPHRSK